MTDVRNGPFGPFPWIDLILPNAMDGPAEITQAPIEPGDTFTY